MVVRGMQTLQTLDISNYNANVYYISRVTLPAFNNGGGLHHLLPCATELHTTFNLNRIDAFAIMLQTSTSSGVYAFACDTSTCTYLRTTFPGGTTDDRTIITPSKGVPFSIIIDTYI